MKQNYRLGSKKLSLLLLCCGWALVLGSAESLFAQTTTTASPQAFGDWNDPTTWDTGVVPTGSSSTPAYVVIDADDTTDTTVALEGGQGLVNGLSIGSGDRLLLRDDASSASKLTFQGVDGADFIELVNESIIELQTNNGFSHDQKTTLDFQSNVVLLGGGAVKILGGAVIASSEASDTAVFRNQDNLIHGYGQFNIGSGSTNDQAGRIIADQAGKVLSIEQGVSGASLSNQGQLVAQNGAGLDLSVSIDNTGGLIRAEDSGVIRVQNDINGGRLETRDSGRIDLARGVLEDVTLDGKFAVFGSLHNFDVGISGEINNLGSMELGQIGDTVEPGGLRVGESTTLKGSGTIRMLSSGSQITDDPPFGVFERVPGRLTNVNNLIQGVGTLGSETMQVINEAGGVIEALSLAPDGLVIVTNQPLVNRGVLRAKDGGYLSLTTSGIATIEGVVIQNEGGLIESTGSVDLQNGDEATELPSVVNITGTTIVGGTLRTTGAGQFRINKNFGSATEISTRAQGADLIGNFVLGEDARFGIQGTLENETGIHFSVLADSEPVHEGSEIVSQEDVVLTGGGNVTLNGERLILTDGSTYPQSDGFDGGLTNFDNTISGYGGIAYNVNDFINEANGVVDANISGKAFSLSTGSNNNAVVNRGKLRASNGGTLSILGSGDGDNAGELTNNGSIEAMDGSKVVLTNAKVVGGSINGQGSGQLLISREGNGAPPTELENVSLNLPVNMEFVSRLKLNGEIVNLGSINATTHNFLTIGENTTLSGGGFIQLGSPDATTNFSQSTITASSSSPGGNRILTNVNNTIQGFGAIGGTSLSIVNQEDGVIQANVSGMTLTISSLGDSPLNNRGTLRAANGGTLALTDPEFSNNGVVVTESMSTFSGEGQLTNAVGGTLQGNGTIAFATVINEGTIAPGVSPGTLKIIGDLLMGENSVLEIEAVGTEVGMYDSLLIDGNAFLGGTLSVDLTGFTGDVTDELVFLSANEVTGSFDNVVFGNSLRSKDGRFDFVVRQDNSLASSNRLFLTNISVAAVPEPSSIGLLCLAALFSLNRRRRLAL